MAKAVGIIEVFGLACAFVAADAGCKAADVVVENFDKNKPGNADALPVPLIVCIKFRGDVSAVAAAAAEEEEEEAAAAAAEKISGVVSRHVIANPEGGTQQMLKLNAFDKN